MAAAFGVSEEELPHEFQRRIENPQPVIEVSSSEAPVHQMKLHRRPDRPHQAAVPSAARIRRQRVPHLRPRLRDRARDRSHQCRRAAAVAAQQDRVRHQRDRRARICARSTCAAPSAASACRSPSPAARTRSTSWRPACASARTRSRWSARCAASRCRWSIAHQRHPRAGRRRDDPRGLSARVRLFRAGGALWRVHGLLRPDAPRSHFPLSPPSPCARTCCINRCCTARAGCSATASRPTCRRCASRPRAFHALKSPGSTCARRICRASPARGSTCASPSSRPARPGQARDLRDFWPPCRW